MVLSRQWPSVAALAACLALAFAVGCGSDDGSAGNDTATATAGDDRQQARATVERLYAAIADGDAEGVCAELNERAQQQIAAGGLGSKSGSCAESFQGFLDRAEKAGGLNLTLKAKVRAVRVDGDAAVAKVRFGSSAQDGEIPLSRVDGEWKLDAVGAR
jgi:ketosteroid isomerase-like protein